MGFKLVVFKLLKDLHPRTANAIKNSFWGLVIRGSGIFISLISVPITFDYLSKTTYGVWLTISSFTTLWTLLDIGISNGLRNQFAAAVTIQDHALARSYLSTAYVLFGGIQLSISLLFIIGNQYIPWQQILNTDINNNELRTVALIVFLSSGVKLVLDLLNFILFALQNPVKANFIQLLINILILLALYNLSHYSSNNLINLAIITSIIPISVMIISSIVFYRKSLSIYQPSFKLAGIDHINSLLNLGYKFFLIQAAVLIIFYTDNVIISQLFGSSEVTPYNIVFRYFNLAGTIFSIIISPFWSAYTEAYIKKDYAWMRSIYRRLQQLWICIAVLVIGMLIAANYIYRLWLGDRVDIPILLSLFMGLSVIITCWNNVTVSIINGMSKIKLQLYSAITSALINIPLAIFFGQYLQLGSIGVILATCISLLSGSILGTIQAKKLINNVALGIWAS